MATINLGAIKFTWKGTYAGGTAYVVDDVVEYNGSSYICILASTGNLPTNATYFEQMSAKGTAGTDGTDFSTILTTQGDLLYRDGSGIQRLGAGTSGQFLKTLGTGANPAWSDAGGGDYVKLVDTNFDGSTVYNNLENVFDSQYSHFIIKLTGVYRNTSGGGALKMRFGVGSTPTYRTTGYTRAYDSFLVVISSSFQMLNNGSQINQSEFNFNTDGALPGTGDTASGQNFHIELFDINSTTLHKRFHEYHWGGEGAGYWAYGNGAGVSLNGNVSDPITGIQFFETTASVGMYGNMKLYGVK